MGFLQCRRPIWRTDDFTECINRDLFQILLPTIVAALSIATILSCFIRRLALHRSKQLRGYHALKTDRNSANGAVNSRIITDDGGNDTDNSDDGNDVFAEHLSLRQVSIDIEVKHERPLGELIAVVLEALCIVGILVVQAIVVAYAPDFTNRGTGALLMVWIYTLGLVMFRLSGFNEGKHGFTDPWNHTALIYMSNFIFLASPFRSALIHPKSHLSQFCIVSQFCLVSLLCVITISVTKGNSVVVQKVTGGLEPSREPEASLFSLATFSWVDSIVWKGYWKPFVLNEIWNLRNDDIAASVLSAFRQTKKTTSLAWVLAGFFKRDLIIQALWAAFASLFIFAPTLLLRVILEYIEAPENTPKNVAWLFVVFLFISASVAAISNGQALFIGRRVCIRLRAIIIGEIYSKALRRKASAGLEQDLSDKGKDVKELVANEDGQANVGAIINLMSVDSFKVSEVCAYLHFLVAAAPIQFIIAVVLLYQILGWSSIAGIGIMLLLMPVNYFISSRFSSIQKEIMETTDKRIHTTNEVLQNIHIIKYFAWEERFGHVVGERRSVELKQLRKRYVLWAIAATSWYASPMVITFLSFLCYTAIEKKDLNPPVAFTALSLFNVLRVPLDQLADMITNVLQTKVSVDRVERFLQEEETQKYHQLKNEGNHDAPLIGFKKASFSWSTKQPDINKSTNDAFRLLDINLEFISGELNIVTGPTGCGKTSLLMALLGEMVLLTGSVHLPGSHSREDLIPDPDTGLIQSVAYCAQQPWLVNDTIKNNILFASPFNESRYQAVLDACSLVRDLQILQHGDETEVGEKGIALSGGQKQRISLARALYSDAAHLLLDDCLSAVDTHTAKWLYQNCITGPLMKGRTCILVTHNVALCIPRSKHIVVLDNGRLIMQGDPKTVVNSGILGARDMVELSTGLQCHSHMLSSVEQGINGDGVDRVGNGPSNEQPDGTVTNSSNGVIQISKKKVPTEETKTEGSVDFSVYLLYFASMGPWWYWILVITVFVLQQVGAVATSVWIREWASNYSTSSITVQAARFLGYAPGYLGSCYASGSCLWFLSGTHQPVLTASAQSTVDIWYYLGVYAVLGLTYSALSFLREIIVFAGSLRASKTIHQLLLHNVMRARAQFFDSTPLGRIMNRFSKDIEAIDQEVAPVALGMIHSLGSVVAIVILISVITPGFLLAGMLISGLYTLIGAFYLRASRDLKRLESIQRSPLFQHFGETLSGVSTIRAYGDERRFVRENLQKIDDQNRPFFYLWACNRWLGFRVDIAGALVSFFAGVFVIIRVGKIDAGLAGLSLTYAITFTDNVLWLVRLYANNEQCMNSVERIREYLEVEQEAPEIIEDNRPPASWPDKGAISFKNYSTRYRADLDPVLRNISFTILSGEKIGIVGRTGAGKSSLALALFRSLEAETGSIEIDGIDISKIGLKDLRQSITMVPQDPTLFTGTIRSNLDPFGINTDSEVFAALKRVHLINEEPEIAAPIAGDDSIFNKNIFLDLQSPVAESGNNLSQGQRQLLCLARALLREPTVLIMDEATASIDYKTDSKIQSTLRNLESTTITIAHRLNSVVYNSKIAVLEQGKLVEFGSPHELLQNPKGVFYSMCQSSGEMEFLQEVARKTYLKNNDRLID